MTLDASKIEAIKADIIASTENNKIACERARGIAHKHGVSTRSVGDIINELGIRIHDCGLGCF